MKYFWLICMLFVSVILIGCKSANMSDDIFRDNSLESLNDNSAIAAIMPSLKLNLSLSDEAKQKIDDGTPLVIDIIVSGDPININKIQDKSFYNGEDQKVYLGKDEIIYSDTSLEEVLISDVLLDYDALMATQNQKYDVAINFYSQRNDPTDNNIFVADVGAIFATSEDIELEPKYYVKIDTLK